MRQEMENLNQANEHTLDSSPEDFENRLRRVRITATVLAAISAASLGVAMSVSPVPFPFVLFAFAVGGIMAVGASLGRTNNFGMLVGIVIGIMIGSWIFLRDLLFPGLSDDFLTEFWPGMSSWALGFSLAALPLVRISLERKRPSIRTDLASAQQFRDRGDSATVAQLRVSALKMGKGRIVTMIVLGSVMEGFGLLSWLFMDLRVGLVLAVMMSLPVAFFTWMLKLLDGRSSHDANRSSQGLIS
jgi:fatty acid desaturase